MPGPPDTTAGAAQLQRHRGAAGELSLALQLTQLHGSDVDPDNVILRYRLCNQETTVAGEGSQEDFEGSDCKIIDGGGKVRWIWWAESGGEGSGLPSVHVGFIGGSFSFRIFDISSLFHLLHSSRTMKQSLNSTWWVGKD